MEAERVRVLFSRFPDHITPGALPVMPALVSIHPHLLKPGTWIVFRWFNAGGPHHEQSAPEFYGSLAEAWFRVPAGYAAVTCPDDFAHMAYAPARDIG